MTFSRDIYCPKTLHSMSTYRHASIHQVNLSTASGVSNNTLSLFALCFFYFVYVQPVINFIAAPENKDTLVVLMPISHIAPNNVNRIDELIKSARANIIKIIETRLKMTNFEELIETEIINDPRTWQSKVCVETNQILCFFNA